MSKTGLVVEFLGSFFTTILELPTVWGNRSCDYWVRMTRPAVLARMADHPGPDGVELDVAAAGKEAGLAVDGRSTRRPSHSVPVHPEENGNPVDGTPDAVVRMS
jgi:hypothetical protein